VLTSCPNILKATKYVFIQIFGGGVEKYLFPLVDFNPDFFDNDILLNAKKNTEKYT